MTVKEILKEQIEKTDVLTYLDEYLFTAGEHNLRTEITKYLRKNFPMTMTTNYDWKVFKSILEDKGYSLKWNGKYHTVKYHKDSSLVENASLTGSVSKSKKLTSAEIVLLRKVIELVKENGVHNFISYLSFEEEIKEDIPPLTEDEVYNTKQLLTLLTEQAKVFQQLK